MSTTPIYLFRHDSEMHGFSNSLTAFTSPEGVNHYVGMHAGRMLPAGTATLHHTPHEIPLGGLSELFTALHGAESGSSGYYLKDFTINDAIEDIKRLQSERREAWNDRVSAIAQLNAKVAELENVRRGTEVTLREYD